MQVIRSTLTSEEAAQYLGMSYTSLMRLVRAKKVPHIRLQGRVLFRTDTLNNWMQEQEQESLKHDEESEESLPLKLMKAR